MGAAELALDWTDAPGGDEAIEVAQTESRPELVTLEKQRGRRGAGAAEAASTGFVYDGAAAGRALRAGLSRRFARALPLPMEEVLLYVKSIEGQHVRRAADPADKRAWRRMVGYGALAVLVLVITFGPRAWLRHSSYRQAELIEKRTELREIQDHLRVRHAQVSDLRRVMARAATAGLQAPTTDRYVWQAAPLEQDADAPAVAIARPLEGGPSPAQP
jgi:hypothetical protein